MEKLNELTLTDAINGLKKGDFTSGDLVEACYKRTEKFDGVIKAIVTILPKEKQLEIAKSADEEIAKKGKEVFEEKPLLGIPYSVKDSFNTKGIQTTASSNILKGYIPPYESTVTQRLKDAGAILIAKDNMDAFAHGASTETSDFFVTKNPWNTDRVPGGSSGGTAAALASNMVIFGFGEDTGGSIRGPAAWCGISGLKPSYGRISRYGVIAMASSTDSPGPMTKTVEDSALVLKVVAGKDPLDGTTSKVETPDYEKVLGDLDLKGKVIGRPKSFFSKDADPQVLKSIDEALKVLEQLGAKVKDVEFLDPKYSLAVYTIVQRSEVSSNLARFDGIRYGHDRSAFGFEARKRMMLGAYALSTGYYDEYYSTAQKVRTLVIENFKKVFEEVDLVIGPTMPIVAPDLGTYEKSPVFGELMDTLNIPASIAGLPALSVPCGFASDLPVGLQIIGPQFSEEVVLSAGHAYQQETNYHKKYPSLEKAI